MMLRIVSVKPSHTQHVQFAAVKPPRRMSSNTGRPKSEMIRPSMTMELACKSEGMGFPRLANCVSSARGTFDVLELALLTVAGITALGQSRAVSAKAPQRECLTPFPSCEAF